MDKPVCVITGGGRGIGRAIRNHLEDEYTVVSVGRSTENHVICDLLQVGERKDLLSTIARYTGNIEVLINNAAVQKLEPAATYALEDWYDQLEMLTAYFDLSQQAYKLGAKRIINIASVVGIRGSRGCVGYSVAKAGVIHMTKCLSNEWGKTCTVNCIAPSWTNTDMLTLSFDNEEHRQRIIEFIPAQRIGEVEDLLPAVDYLLAADYVTGAVLVVDGGFINR